MDCPLTEKARREFVLTTKLETFFQGTSSWPRRIAAQKKELIEKLIKKLIKTLIKR